MHRLLQSTLRNANAKDVSAGNSLQKHLARVSILAKSYRTEAPLQKDEKDFKGHRMLAPFTAGWQTTDLNPLVIERSEGSYVYNTKGKKYLDSLAGLWCTSLGGSERRLVEAATKQLNKLPFYHSFWNRTTKPSLDLADELLEMFTASKMSRVFFTNSGSEANDSQVKLVWYYNNALGRPNKKKFIARLNTMVRHLHQPVFQVCQCYTRSSISRLRSYCIRTALITGALAYQVKLRRSFQPGWPITWKILSSKRDLTRLLRLSRNRLWGQVERYLHPQLIFRKFRPYFKKYDILFIADEVICAFGRVGTMFACDKYGIKPDLVTLAKALSSAYMPIGAVLVSPEVYDVIHSQSNQLGVFAHGFTYSGHPVSCAVALETLKIYKERNILEQVNKIAPKFQEGVKAFSSSPIIGEIRGTGLILGTEFTDNKSPNDPFPPEWGVGNYFRAQCEKHGMLVSANGDNVMMSPSFVMTPGEIDELIEIYGKALKATEERVLELKSPKK